MTGIEQWQQPENLELLERIGWPEWHNRVGRVRFAWSKEWGWIYECEAQDGEWVYLRDCENSYLVECLIRDRCRVVLEGRGITVVWNNGHYHIASYGRGVLKCGDWCYDVEYMDRFPDYDSALIAALKASEPKGDK